MSKLLSRKKKKAPYRRRKSPPRRKKEVYETPDGIVEVEPDPPSRNEQQARCAELLARRLDPATIILTLRREFKMSPNKAKACVRETHRSFWNMLQEFAEPLKDFLGQHALLGGIMLDHARSLRKSIEITMDRCLNGDADPALFQALERFHRQYAELFGLLSSGPTIMVNQEVTAEDGKVRTIVQSANESKAKSILARLAQCNQTSLDRYVMKHLPHNTAYDQDENGNKIYPRQLPTVDADILGDDEMPET